MELVLGVTVGYTRRFVKTAYFGATLAGPKRFKYFPVPENNEPLNLNAEMHTDRLTRHLPSPIKIVQHDLDLLDARKPFIGRNIFISE